MPIQVDNLEDIQEFTGAFYVNCPFCEKRGHTPDTKHKLGVTFAPIDRFHCYRCEITGVATELMESRLSKEIVFTNIVSKLFAKPVPVEKASMLELIDYDSISFKIESYHLNAINYLTRTRGLSRAEIEFYDIRIGNNKFPNYRGRLLVPTFDIHHNCVYVVGRDYVHEDPQAKYRNPPESHKQYALWNGDKLTPGCVCVITEGVFSGMSAGRSLLPHMPTVVPVTIFGKYMSVQQALIISKASPSRVIVSLDGGVSRKVIDENVSILKKFYRGDVSIVMLPGEEDPDSMLPEDYSSLVRRSMSSSLNIVM